MERTFARRLFLGQSSIVLVIVLSTVTAVVALRAANRQTEQTAAIDQRLALLDRIKSETRELAASGRRHVMTGEAKALQRVGSLADTLSRPQPQLASADLDEALDDYVHVVVRGAANDRADPRALAVFEEDLMPARARLKRAFDSIAARERMLRDATLSSQRLAQGAQWALLVAAALTIVLVVGTTLAVRRQLRRQAAPPPQPTLVVRPIAPNIAGRRRQQLDATTVQVGPVSVRRRTYWFTLAGEPRVLR